PRVAHAANAADRVVGVAFSLAGRDRVDALVIERLAVHLDGEDPLSERSVGPEAHLHAGNARNPSAEEPLGIVGEDVVDLALPELAQLRARHRSDLQPGRDRKEHPEVALTDRARLDGMAEAEAVGER